MNRTERANHLKTFAALGLLVFGLSGCNSGEINCLTGQRSGVRNYPNVAEYQTVNFQGVQIRVGSTGPVGPAGLNEESRLNLTVNNLFWTIDLTATQQSATNNLSTYKNLKVEWQCIPQ